MFVDTTDLWNLEARISKHLPNVHNIALRALHELYPRFAHEALKQIGNIESFCTKNNCRSTRLAGFYEWFILSGIEVLRNGPKQMLVNELLKQGVLTSPFDKSTLAGTYTHALVGVDTCSTEGYHRKRMYERMTSLITYFSIPSDFHEALVNKIRESFPNNSRASFVLDGIEVGTANTAHYKKNTVHILNAFSKNYIDEHGTMRDDFAYDLSKPTHSLFRVTSEALVKKPGIILYELTIPVTYLFTRSGERVALVDNIVIVRINVFTSDSIEHPSLCSSRRYHTSPDRDIATSVPVFTWNGYIQHILHPSRKRDHSIRMC